MKYAELQLEKIIQQIKKTITSTKYGVSVPRTCLITKVLTKRFFDLFFVIIEKISKKIRCIPLRNKNAQTKTDEVSKFLTTS